MVKRPKLVNFGGYTVALVPVSEDVIAGGARVATPDPVPVRTRWLGGAEALLAAAKRNPFWS